MTIQAVEFEEVMGEEKGEPLLKSNLEIIKDVKVKISAVISDTEMTVGELFKLKTDSIIKLHRDVSAPIDLMLDGKIVGRGLLVVVDDNFGVRITEIKA